VLALLIVEGFLSVILTVSNLSPEAKEQGMWAVVGLFVLVVGIVTICVWFRPTNLTYTELGSLVDKGKVPYGTEKREMDLRTDTRLPGGEPTREE
jgi:xanthine/uracil/vitamin C permease (AzgA family)